ncbi:HAD family phosphatase [Tessaracoccus lacteus]|uniref:HAD family phosphatase n=1 Tax=Tessaracoccus lacteus TaxID=3041766 RepID=A0ABY8PU39_9ACTN|nr:HAD family phosphatase [Tessaracoccus sp. T21]WGT45942.1 HAD family phosphatase [Tessaracoccus sp. T21]
MQAEPRAVLWDFDGTMVDTEPVWTMVELEMLAERGLTFTRDVLDSMHGQSAWITAQMLADAFGTPTKMLEVYDELHERLCEHVYSHELPWLPGARRLMSELSDLGVPCAVVTASNRRIVDAAHARLPANVELIVTSDDVTHTKPHPEPYMMAARALGLSPRETVVLEDSLPGVTSGLAAGAIVYAVNGRVALTTDPRLVVSSTGLTTTSWNELADVWRTRSEITA